MLHVSRCHMGGAVRESTLGQLTGNTVEYVERK